MKNISDDNLWNEKEDISFDGIINKTVQNIINKILCFFEITRVPSL